MLVEGSVTYVAKRRFLSKAPSVISYLLGSVGVGLIARGGHWRSPTAAAGAFICAAGIGLFTAVQRGIVRGLTTFCEDALKADMRDIGAHYRAPAAFFVAARPRSTDTKKAVEEEEVVGYVGLEYQPDKDASVAEVRRMIVSAKHRRRGIAVRLMHALIAHAEALPGLQYIELGTSEFQPGAQRMYEKLGWQLVSVERAGNWLGSLELRHFRRPVGTGIPGKL
ncbi:acyl-CoA N-acyltransferase [Mycena maculata]|uniref:Acyl-CoA N-acyltransferase n=1 Tax=Mycena maculata TaxID=230809 RepID=A0AAD7J080_9AGAR|nr:acyl-CoA N-acyltransferase [Mycena maculata]